MNTYLILKTYFKKLFKNIITHLTVSLMWQKIDLCFIKQLNTLGLVSVTWKFCKGATFLFCPFSAVSMQMKCMQWLNWGKCIDGREGRYLHSVERS